MPRHADAPEKDSLPVSPLVWRPALRAAFLGGCFSALTTAFPAALLGFGFMAGGAFAVYAYRKRISGATLNFAAGASLGALSGLLGFLALVPLAIVRLVFFPEGQERRRAVFEAMDKMVQTTDPQLQQQVQDTFSRFKTPEGFMILTIVSAVCVCLMFVFFSTLGGAIGASITRKTPK